MYAAEPTREMTDTWAQNNGCMDRWISGGQKNEVFVRDAETNGCLYPKAVGEKSDGSSWDMKTSLRG